MTEQPITAEQIEKLVIAFYAQVREHETLGPIFNAAIGTDALSITQPDVWKLS